MLLPNILSFLTIIASRKFFQFQVKDLIDNSLTNASLVDPFKYILYINIR
uniref:Uncharacterized protein n=1 Tax=Meloidogyne enterolobii TaxID=390850 RepID=A0A6V7UE44_MELEN|nr:unnamed protein product [Meloidogyne enterolobii]